MKCWNCENAETLTQGQLNGGEYPLEGDIIAWCKAFNASIEEIKDSDYDIVNCKHYEREEVVL